MLSVKLFVCGFSMLQCLMIACQFDVRTVANWLQVMLSITAALFLPNLKIKGEKIELWLYDVIARAFLVIIV